MYSSHTLLHERGDKRKVVGKLRERSIRGPTRRDASLNSASTVTLIETSFLLTFQMAVKRKSDSGVAISNAKKAKTDVSQHASAKAILASCQKLTVSALDFSSETEVRKALKDVANYVQDLENEVEELKKAQAEHGGAKHVKSKEQIEAEADLVADKLVRGIKKQMTVSGVS